jgi:hypothetical protein
LHNTLNTVNKASRFGSYASDILKKEIKVTVVWNHNQWEPEPSPGARSISATDRASDLIVLTEVQREYT